MELKDKKIILASGSPRRKEILEGMDLCFETDTRNSFKEEFGPDIPHEEIPALMSRGKSHGFHRELGENEILVTADTTVVVGDRVLGKPADRDDATAMLRLMSGREHTVITGVTLRSARATRTFKSETSVWFRKMTDEEIAYYVDNFRPYDKAGAYGIQEWIGYVAIERIEGSFYNVMGLPVQKLYTELNDFTELQ